MNLELQKSKLEQADDLDLTVSILKSIIVIENLSNSSKDTIVTLISWSSMKSERLRMQFSPAQRMEEIKEQLSQEVANA